MSDPLGPIVITAREIYDAVVRLTAAVEGLLKDHGDASRQLGDHENRIRSLERGRWPLPTVNALLGVGALVVALLALIR